MTTNPAVTPEQLEGLAAQALNRIDQKGETAAEAAEAVTGGNRALDALIVRVLQGERPAAVLAAQAQNAEPESRVVRYVNTPTPALQDGDLVLTHGVVFRLRDRKPTSTGEGVWFKTDVVLDTDPERLGIPAHWLDDWTIQGNARATWAKVIDPLPRRVPEGDRVLFVFAGTAQ